MSLTLIEKVIELIGIVIHYVAVDGSRTAIEHIHRLALKVGEVLVHIRVENLVVVALAVIRQQRVEHHVLTRLMVVDSLRSPHARHILPQLRILRREVDSRVRPMDQVG